MSTKFIDVDIFKNVYLKTFFLNKSNKNQDSVQINVELKYLLYVSELTKKIHFKTATKTQFTPSLHLTSQYLNIGLKVQKCNTCWTEFS